MTAGEICTRSVVTAHPEETVVEAARRMRDRHVGDLLVTDTEGRLVGILTDRDIVVSAVAQSPDKLDVLLVGDVMSHDLLTVRSHQLLDEGLKKMRARGVRRLPVLGADGKIEGILAFDDILEVMSEELRELVGLVAREQKREREVRA
jgi:CBS domain-containing protein